MNGHTIRTIAFKDLKEVAQNRGVWVPAVIVPIIFLVLLPLAAILVPRLANVPVDEFMAGEELGAILNRMPGMVTEQLAGLTGHQALVVLVTGYFLAPFFLIMPLMFSSIVGAESFAGEKERKTIEALIYTPATDGELFLGKVVAAVVPAVALALLSFAIYAVVVNAAGWPVMGRVWFPPVTWWPLLLWVVPAVATLGMAATVLISSRVSTFMEAYQISGSLVVLVLALVAGQISGVLFLSFAVELLVGAAVWLIDAVLIYFGVRTFAREQLLARL